MIAHLGGEIKTKLFPKKIRFKSLYSCWVFSVAVTFSGKMMTSPVEAFSTRGSPFDSRQVYGGNVTSFSLGYCGTQGTPKCISKLKRDGFHDKTSLDMFTIENGLMSPPIWVRPTLISTTVPLPLA